MRKSKPSSARLPIVIVMTTTMIKMTVMMMLIKMAIMIKMMKVHYQKNLDLIKMESFLIKAFQMPNIPVYELKANEDLNRWDSCQIKKCVMRISTQKIVK